MSKWQTTIRKNWPYMLTAALLSLFLWVAVSADTVGQQAIDADLVIVNQDPRFVVTERQPSTDVVSVVFTGRLGDLTALWVQRPQLVVLVDSVGASLVWDVDLSPDMVAGRGGRDLGDVRAVTVSPQSLRLRFQPKGEKTVRVVARLDIKMAGGFVQSDSVHLEPRSVNIVGPAPSVAQVDSIFTVPIVREQVSQSINLTVPLEQPAPRGLLTLSVPNVRLSVPVEPRSERVFPGIPLSLSGMSGSELKLSPSLVDVRVSGPRSAVESVRPEALLPWVEVGDQDDYDRLLPIILPAPAPFLEITIDPDSARVLSESDKT